MYSRHDLVWLGAAAWDAALGQVPGHLRAPIAQWRQSGWPAVVRRPEPGVPDGVVCVGIPLPPDPVTRLKPRVGLQVEANGIVRQSAPLALASALGAAPAKWQDALSPLTDLGLHAYGSLAMQAITGLPYLTAASDADILFRPKDRAELQLGLERMSLAAGCMPLDGEIVFPDGAAVAWKEWRGAANGGGKVLVKSLGGVRLATVDELIASLEAV